MSNRQGYILGDYDKYKACNFCIHFMGYGIYAFDGKCFKLNKDVNNGYFGGYAETAKTCKYFECKPKFISNE